MKYYVYVLAAFCAIFSSSTVWADASASQKQGGIPQTVVLLGTALVFFYFILWRPEQKRRKLVQKQRSSMKVGDHVTAMGILGTIDKIEDKTVILKMFDGAKIEMLKDCITEVHATSDVSAV